MLWFSLFRQVDRGRVRRGGISGSTPPEERHRANGITTVEYPQECFGREVGFKTRASHWKGLSVGSSFYRARFGGVAVSPDEAEGLARALESA